MIIRILAVSLLAVGIAAAAPAQPTDWTVAAQEGGGGRLLFVKDPILLEIASNPEFEPEFTDAVTADEKGKVAHAKLRSGWAYCAYESPEERTVIVTGRGFHSLFVNGERFAGDFYRHGLLRMPLHLRKGLNHLLVRAIRGEFTIRFSAAKGECSLSPRDVLLPDLRDGGRFLVRTPGAVVVLNHQTTTMDDAVLEVGDGRLFERVTVPVRPILPVSFLKAGFPLRQLRGLAPADLDVKGHYRLPVTLHRGRTQHTALLPMTIRETGEAYRETRVSGIDGSVQYHAVRPPIRTEKGKRYALYLSLHGAGVPAYNQARAYRAKPDAFVIAPTNRRRFGFDWQDWGRLDALEALEFALRRYPIDPNRVYLTGHSMGGHGTWHLGVLHPSRFAAIAPSAGWASFYSYGGGMTRAFGNPRLGPFTATHLENATRELVRNLSGTPVYVLHGEKDDNVPVRESREMVKLLGSFHPDFTYHEQPGAGHWWGNECVDWDPLFEFCRRHVRVEHPLQFTFRTFNPAVTSRYAWLTVHSQIVPARMSRVTVKARPGKGTVEIEAENVRLLRLDLAGVLPGSEARILVEGSTVPVTVEGPVFLARGASGSWSVVPSPATGLLPMKSPARGGPFKLAFARRMVWVYGTEGNEEENAATLAKVRYDAQVWWYRANGSVVVLPDHDFDPNRFRRRNVILFGNADTNSAFEKLLPGAPDTESTPQHLVRGCPITVNREVVTVGKRSFAGDAGLFMVYPKADGGLVGVVGATTPRMMRLAQQCRYFVSGTACPDWVVYTDDTLHVGMEGVAASGYFTNRWRLAGEKER